MNQAIETCNSMDESQNDYVERQKSDKKKCIMYACI